MLKSLKLVEVAMAREEPGASSRARERVLMDRRFRIEVMVLGPSQTHRGEGRAAR